LVDGILLTKFHGVKFIHENRVARRNIPWLGTYVGSMVFNKPKVLLYNPLKEKQGFSTCQSCPKPPYVNIASKFQLMMEELTCREECKSQRNIIQSNNLGLGVPTRKLLQKIGQ
jgi:hypothetical protein